MPMCARTIQRQRSVYPYTTLIHSGTHKGIRPRDLCTRTLHSYTQARTREFVPGICVPVHYTHTLRHAQGNSSPGSVYPYTTLIHSGTHKGIHPRDLCTRTLHSYTQARTREFVPRIC